MNLEQELASLARQVERQLLRRDGVSPADLSAACRHLLGAGGKRLRPALLLLSGSAVGGRVSALLPAAAAVELVHTFTLIHDDIMDRDTRRRGVPTVHVKYGLPLAILAGDTLFARAFQELGEARAEPGRKARASAMLAEACVEICAGQALDMAFETRSRVSESEYLRMVGWKTAALFRASAGLGGLLGGGSPAAVRRLEAYGWNLGLAFQIQDDLLGLTATRAEFGKSVGIDLRRKKKTLVAIHARSRGYVPGPRVHVRSAVQQMERRGSLDYAKRKAEEFQKKAAGSLVPLEESRPKRMLLELADYAVRRAY